MKVIRRPVRFLDWGTGKELATIEMTKEFKNYLEDTHRRWDLSQNFVLADKMNDEDFEESEETVYPVAFIFDNAIPTIEEKKAAFDREFSKTKEEYEREKEKEKEGFHAYLTKSEEVNHPSRYNKGGMEVIDIIDAYLGREAREYFDLSNVVKYILRFQDKNGFEDIKKAQFYLNDYISLQEEEDDD